MRMLIPLLVCLTAVARQTDAVRAKPQDPSQTAIACAFPDSGLDFSLYRMNVTTSAAGGGHQKGKSVDADKEEQFGFGFGLNFNADSHPSSGVLFSSDVNGSTGIYHHSSSNLTGGPPGGGKNELLWSAGASMNDHARWHPDGSRYAFTSTMQPSKFNNEGWTAVYLTSINGPLNGHQPIRLSESATPAAEYSPSFSPCGNWVAVARGSGAPGMTNISVYNAQTRSGPFQASKDPKLRRTQSFEDPKLRRTQSFEDPKLLSRTQSFEDEAKAKDTAALSTTRLACLSELRTRRRSMSSDRSPSGAYSLL